MDNYIFTENWFGADDLIQFLKFNPEDELHFLEIGSYEGRSTVWFLNNLLKHERSAITCIDPWKNFSQNADSFNSYGLDGVEWKTGDQNIKDRFYGNVNETGVGYKVFVYANFSHITLPELITRKNRYDLIYIDGNHTAPFVLSDAVMGWSLLKKGGIMVFDDYTWTQEGDETLSPRIAVDTFIRIYKSYLTVIWDGYKKAIQKT
jgi:predicted O-methyltransferase YrrM